MCSFFQAATNTFPINEGKNRMRLSYPRTSMINACPFCFCVILFFLILFWFHYHFFSGFSTVHLSFMEMVKRHKNFESYFLRHYVSSNHFFLLFYPSSDCKKRNVSYLFSRWIRQTDRCSTSKLASILSKRNFYRRCPKINWNKKDTNCTWYRNNYLLEFFKDVTH